MKTKYYQITSIAKEDILARFEGDKEIKKIKKIVKNMTDGDMEYLASKMADDYCNQLFWDSLGYIFKDRFMENK